MRARIAAHTRWAKTPDRTAATAAQRQAFLDRFEREVDPDGTLAPDVRAKLAENAKSAHFTRLAMRSAQSRRRPAHCGTEGATP
jgi:hypothetical protein